MSTPTKFEDNEIDLILQDLLVQAKAHGVAINTDRLQRGERIDPRAYRSTVEYGAISIIDQLRAEKSQLQAQLRLSPLAKFKKWLRCE